MTGNDEKKLHPHPVFFFSYFSGSFLLLLLRPVSSKAQGWPEHFLYFKADE